MAASAWAVVHTAKNRIGDKQIDLNTDVFKCMLLSSAWTPDLAAQADYADISANELTTANGYTAGGLALTSVTWANSAGTQTWDADDPLWTATDSGITARYAVIYDDTDTSKTLICYSLLDTAPADVTADAGNAFVIQLDASGLFTLA